MRRLLRETRGFDSKLCDLLIKSVGSPDHDSRPHAVKAAEDGVLVLSVLPTDGGRIRTMLGMVCCTVLSHGDACNINQMTSAFGLAGLGHVADVIPCVSIGGGY